MKIILWIVVILLLVGGGWWYFSMQPASAPAPTTTTTVTDQAAASDATTPVATTTPPTAVAPMTANVIYGAQGFTPNSVTVAKGGTVTWVNQSGSSMWVASANHPSHTLYSGTTRDQHCPDTSGTAFDECAPGDNYSFTFTKTGTWGYHNHTNSSAQGTVIVQ